LSDGERVRWDGKGVRRKSRVGGQRGCEERTWEVGRCFDGKLKIRCVSISGSEHLLPEKVLQISIYTL